MRQKQSKTAESIYWQKLMKRLVNKSSVRDFLLFPLWHFMLNI